MSQSAAPFLLAFLALVKTLPLSNLMVDIMMGPAPRPDFRCSATCYSTQTVK